MLRRRRATVVVAAGVAVAVAAAVVWQLSGGRTAAAGAVTTQPVRRGTLTVTASAAGTVQPIDSRALTFGASGVLATLAVKPGDHVTAGQLLATLDPTDAQAAVTSAQSALDAAETNLTLAEDQAATPTPTPTCVAAAAFTIYPSASPSASPSPSVSPSPSASGSPRPSPSTSPRSPRPSPSQSRPSTCGNAGGGGGGSATGRGQSSGTDSLMRAQQSVNNAELALEQAQSRLAGTLITAPVSGRVLSVAGAVGQNVSAGGSGFIVLGGVHALVVEAHFSEADVAAVAVGQKATVTLADHPGVTYAATVSEIDPAGTASGQLIRYGVQLEFTDPPSDLLLGQTADAAVVTGSSAPDVLYVPTGALRDIAGDSATVLVRTSDGDVTKTVGLGFQGDQGTEIVSGLTAADTVVIGGR